MLVTTVLVSLINCVVVGTVVLIHYQSLFGLTRLMPRLMIRHQLRIIIGVVGALLAHIVEVWVFALAYYLVINVLGWGTLQGAWDGDFSGLLYYSFTSFTTLGFGDISPIGGVRFLTAIESLTGLVLITWTASFLYLEMQLCWTQQDGNNQQKDT